MTSLDGVRFGVVENPSGEGGPGTEFVYHEREGIIWGEYSGGNVRFGVLMGTRDGDEADFRYAQVNNDGERNTGHCRARIETLSDGRLRLHETWEWTSKEGSGISVIEQLP